jgi:hypothetical protein
MIPPFNQQQLLPLFVGALTLMAGHSPFITTKGAVVDRFATSPVRCAILGGLLDYRAALRAAGMVEGYPWLAGSFVEGQVTAPNDVDVVTFHLLDPAADDRFAVNHPMLVEAPQTRSRHKVDAQFVSLRASRPWTPVRDSTFWFGLFSHQRTTQRWKGLLQVQLDTPSEDEAARTLLAARST